MIFHKGDKDQLQIKINDNIYYYSYYEGSFKQGKLEGPGTLKLRGKDKNGELLEKVLIGHFEDNQFTGSGKEIEKEKITTG